MSNRHTRYNYYQTILDNKHAIATSEFGVNPKLLTINIDLGDLDDNFDRFDIETLEKLRKKHQI